MARIPLPTLETMTRAQREVFDAVVSGPRGMLVGPLRAALHRPELADAWQKFGEILRFRASLPARLTELAILVTARRWNSQIEWYIHAQAAEKAGLGTEAIAALLDGRPPSFPDEEAADVYEFARQMQQTGTVAQDVYDRVLVRWGALGVVELTALIGYYTMVSMTLNAHEIPMPDGAAPPFDPPAQQARPQLSTLPPIATPEG